jgi:hypothetical protein
MAKRLSRKELHVLATREWYQLFNEWKSTDKALVALVTNHDVPAGALRLHGSAWNANMNQLLDSEQLTLVDIRRYVEEARKDLENAKAFVRQR